MDRIAEAACPEAASPASHPPASHPHDTDVPVIEIGPGRGALTESLMERASKVIAIEVDPILVHYLQQKFRGALESGRLELIQGDVLKTDLSGLSPHSPAAGTLTTIAGNLPYYITSPILERLFALDGHWARAVFLVQAEVAARIAAAPGSRDYGYLSVLTQIHARPQVLFDVPRAAFRPAPNVDSAVVLLEPRDAAQEWNLPDKTAFLRFTSACFQHKRKTLRNNLAPVYGKDRLDAMPEGRLRAEQLGVPELAAIYRQLGAPGS